jgi:hypothetical protein
MYVCTAPCMRNRISSSDCVMFIWGVKLWVIVLN